MQGMQPEQQLREHLRAKLAKSKQARELQDALIGNGGKLSEELTRLVGLLAPVQKLASLEELDALSQQLSDWKTDLQELKRLGKGAGRLLGDALTPIRRLGESLPTGLLGVAADETRSRFESLDGGG